MRLANDMRLNSESVKHGHLSYCDYGPISWGGGATTPGKIVFGIYELSLG